MSVSSSTSSSSSPPSLAPSQAQEEDYDGATVSLSEHVHRKVSMCVDASVDGIEKSKALERLLPFVKEVDAYINIAAGGAELPELDWNRQFRKAYNLMFWIRPQLCENDNDNGNGNDNGNDNGNGNQSSSSSSSSTAATPRVLYQFSTHPNQEPHHEDSHAHNHATSTTTTVRNMGMGVSVTASPWTIMESSSLTGAQLIRTTLVAQCLPTTGQHDLHDDDDDNHHSHSHNNNNNHNHNHNHNGAAAGHSSSSSSRPSRRFVRSSMDTSNNNSTTAGAYVTCPLQLTLGKWSLVGINHVFPYLKRPQWTLCVDGRIMGTGELNYPVLEKSMMSYNTLLENFNYGGATPATSHLIVDDDTHEHSPPSKSKSKSFHIHVATVALHPDAIPPSIQALLAEAGPNMSLQQQGRICVQLPPVSNWSKGSSLEGPNVGIPLCTSVQALELQRLASRVIYAFSAASVRVLGTLHSKNPRILCAAATANGDTDQTPKVGLIQPSPVYLEPDAPLKFSGSGVTVHHALSEFLLCNEDGAMVDTQLGLESSKLWSVILLEQAAVSSSILPFFRSLVPPGFLVNLQETLYQQSLRELWNLYSHQGQLAAQYIQFLATMIHYGGGRVHEEVLQSGILHILATTLRRSLVRAHVLGILKEKHPSNDNDDNGDNNEESTTTTTTTLDSFLAQSSHHQQLDLQTLSQKEDRANTTATTTTTTGGGTTTTSSSSSVNRTSSTSTTTGVVCPAVVPPLVAEACVGLIQACCGPASPTLDRLTPAMKVRRSSDLALTCIFGFVLDFDLWGGLAVRETEMILRALAERYGGGDISYGVVLRSQIPLQSFLDCIKLRFDSIYMTHQRQRRRKRQRTTKKTTNNNNSTDETYEEDDEDDHDRALIQIAHHLSQLLFSMILASFSNRRVITQAEHDVAACMGALSDSPLGSIGCHVVLTALELVLKWCDILPASTTTATTTTTATANNPKQDTSTSSSTTVKDRRSVMQQQPPSQAGSIGSGIGSGGRPPQRKSQSLLDIHEKNNAEQERKMQVAARLGRNLLMTQYHDVVAPMLLSRTIFCGERTMRKDTTTTPPPPTMTNKKASMTDEEKDNIMEDTMTTTTTTTAPSEKKEEGTTKDDNDNDNNDNDDDDDDYLLSWKHHWRISLLLFAWVTSISGVDGEISARSTGSLLLASSLAGSLKGCLVSSGNNALSQGDQNQMVALLLLPPPVMAMTVGSGDTRNRDKTGSWSYTDLLTDRLRIAIPLLPGLVVSLVSHPQDTTIPLSLEESDPMDSASLNILSELLFAIGSSFHRVYGGLSATVPKTTTTKKRIRSRRKSPSNSAAVKVAKDNAPSLLTVVMLLENHIQLRKPVVTAAAASSSEEEKEKDQQQQQHSENIIVEVFSSLSKPSDDARSDKDTDWVDVPTVGESIMDSSKAQLPDTASINKNVLTSDVVLKAMVSSQGAILNTLGDLIVNAMRHGGGEASTIVWRSIITALQESVAYSNTSTQSSTSVNLEDGQPRAAENECDPQELATNVLCRLAALVLAKALPKEYEDDVWPMETCAAVSRLCDLIEEKELLQKPRGTIPRDNVSVDDGSHARPYSSDQICLLYSMLEIMTFGRETGGWIQFVPPVVDSQTNNEEDLEASKSSLAVDDSFLGRTSSRPSSRHGRTISSPMRPKSTPTEPETATSKLLLPILQPCLRILVGCLGNIRSTVIVIVPQMIGKAPPSDQAATSGDRTLGIEKMKVPLLSQLANEMKHSLVDAIVGLSFPNARDVALNTLASLRRANIYQQNANDDDAIKICSFIFVAIAEEIRVRYDSERQRRQQTYEYDDYDVGEKADMDKEGAEQSSAQARDSEAQSSREVERLILGGDLIPGRASYEEKERGVETITFGDDSSNHSGRSENEEPPVTPRQRKRSAGGSEDFVMFPDSAASSAGAADANITQLGWSHYKGLGSALEKCSELSQSMVKRGHEKQVEAMLSILSSYLDTWDESVARESAESELVELFDQSVTISDNGKSSASIVPLSPQSSSMVSSGISDLPFMPIMGSETAADAMTNFIELSAIEKSRLKEVATTFLPARRYSCMSFVERYCWAQYMEFVTDESGGSMDKLWERCTADGNRDVRSRLISMPCNPQFRRYIPAYLDHGSSPPPSSQEPISKGEVKEDEEVVDQDNEPEEKQRAAPRHTIVSTEDLEFQKALADAAKVAIVDITKQEIKEEDEEEEDDALEVNRDLTYEEDSGDEGMEDFLGFPNKEEGEVPENANHDGEPFLGFPEDKEIGQREESVHDNIDSVSEAETANESSQVEAAEKAHNVHHNIASSSFSHPPDNSSSTISLLHSSAARMIELHFDNCVHVKTEGCRECTVLLSATHLILEYDAESEGLFDGEMLATQDEAERQRLIDEAGGGFDQKAVDNIVKRHRETAALRPKSMRFNLSELSHVYLRRYRLRDSAIEMFFLPSGGSSFGGFGLYAPATSLFLDFGPGYEGNIRRDDAAHAIMKRAPPQTIKQWPDRSGQFLHEQLSRLTMGWVEGRITNFDYLLHLNILAGRSYNDLCQYPVMPWVLSNYHSSEIPDLTDKANFRDLSKPVGALNPDRLEDFIERFESFADQTIPPFMYGSHYSTSAGVVLHFLVRMHPFAGLHRSLQGGHFDVADRLFSSVPRTWDMCTGASAAEVKELTPEWYCNPSFLKNTNVFKLGTSQDGEYLDDVTLPPWANNSPEKFIEVMRDALESDICSEMLPNWIDLIFGRKQQGPEAIKAHNVFFYLTYYGSVDVASIEDPALRQATELQIAHFGQCPMQLFRRPHVHRVQRWRHFRRQTFYQMLSAYTQGAARGEGDGANKPMLKHDGSQRVIGEPLFLPFLTAPISHWVHLAAPPPGPHADLIAVRLAGVDRCLAVDAQGIFHSFRWAWKPEEESADERLMHQAGGGKAPIDRGCFVAQRELPRFRTVPRLPHVPTKRAGDGTAILPAIGMSKTLFAGRTVLLVLSDGDGRGALAMQLVDPAKGSVRGQAIVSSVHSSRITCIAMDPIGTAAGHGGVGGELAMLGSADGGASIWRFMSSHYFPLRPRVRMRGHKGSKIHAVALSGAIHVCASISDKRCCIFSIGNGAMIRSFPPPQDTLDASYLAEGKLTSKTVFADTPALCLSVQGFLVCVCKTILSSSESESFNRVVITLHLFSLEGVSLGSKALESWRGTPHKITCTPDGTAITVCAGRGITIHRLSAITPLEFIDEWHVAETEALDENLPKAWDVDFGPSIMRPIVGAAACSSGALRLHALPGISAWSEKHKRSSVASQVGQALAKPAQRIKNAFGKGLGLGNKVVGVGKEIGKEVSSDVKERGVGGFLGGFMARKNNSNNDK